MSADARVAHRRQLLGEIMEHYGWLEWLTISMILVLEGDDSPNHSVAVAERARELQQVAAKEAALRAAAAGSAREALILEWFGPIKQLQKTRNRLIHDPWLHNEQTGEWGLLLGADYQDFKMGDVMLVTIGMLSRLRSELEIVTAFAQRLRASVGGPSEM